MSSYVYALRPCTSAPPNCSIQNKKIRNSEYYKEKKRVFKGLKGQVRLQNRVKERRRRPPGVAEGENCIHQKRAAFG